MIQINSVKALLFVACFHLNFAVRCYVCEWSSYRCEDLNCYGNVDYCSSKSFSPSLVKAFQCPGGCENVLVTDPNGLVISARRGCDSSGLAMTTDYYYYYEMQCRTEYQFGTRIDKCICNVDYCNASIVNKYSLNVPILCFLFVFLSKVYLKFF